MSVESSRYYWSLLFAFISIFLWSLSASVAQFLKNEANYLGFTLGIMSCGAIVFGGWMIYDRREWWGELQDLRQSEDQSLIRFALTLTGFSIFLLLYDLTFFFSIQEGPSVPANIINYLWPILFPAFGAILFRRSDATFGIFEASVLSVAFGGTVLIAGDSATFSILNFRYTYLMALVAAVSAGLYLNFLSISQKYIESTQFIYFFGVILAIPLSLIAAAVLKLPIRVSKTSLPFVIGYGFVTFGIGQLTWGKAINLGDDALVSSLAYLTPVLSTIFLNVLVNAPITETVAFAAVLIIVAQVLLNDTFRHFSSVSGALVAVFLTTLYLYVDPSFVDSSEFYTVVDDVIATIFAILSGFMLNRVWQTNQQENKKITQVNNQLSHLISIIDTKEVSDERRAEAYDSIEQLMILIIELNYAKNTANISELSNIIDSKLVECENIFDDAFDPVSENISSAFNEIQGELTDWLMLRQERVTQGEFAILWLLGIATSILLIVNVDDSFVSQLIVISVNGAITFSLLKIRDYNNNRTGSVSIILIEQRVMNEMNRPLYFPSEEFTFNPRIVDKLPDEQTLRINSDIKQPSDSDLIQVSDLELQRYAQYGVGVFVISAVFLVLLLLYARTSGISLFS